MSHCGWSDVASGSADLPRAMLDWAQRCGRRLQVVAIDHSPLILHLAARPCTAGLYRVAARGERLPLADQAVDVATCSLLIHQLTETQAVALLREMRRVARAGARVLEGTAVTALELAGGRVEGVWGRRQGHATLLRSRLVVAADGLHSIVAARLGLVAPIGWPARLGLVARYAGVTGLERQGQMHVGHDLYCGLGPVDDGLVSVGLVGRLDSRRPGESAVAYLERRLDELPAARRALAGGERVTPVRGVGPLARRVSRVAGPGYLLVGDAAGFRDPFTGEGVYRALRGAELAAAQIGAALAAGNLDRLTTTYPAARRALFADRELVTALIQHCLARPRLLDYTLRRLAERPAVARRFAPILGDYQPAAAALRPSFLWSLLRP